MRIEKIEIENFRQYRNIQLNFPYIKGHNDLHIIYARNAVGKTNVLNAITWCLYDSEMHLGDKDTACSKLNNQLVQELRENLEPDGNAIGNILVKIFFTSNDQTEKIIFQRTGSFNVTKEAIVQLNTKFSILHFVDNEWNSVEDEEDTIALVKKNVPEEIHDYIFFDGEHLEDYFKTDKLENVKNGIEELTQAKIIEKAEKAFDKYVKDDLNPQLAHSSIKDISDAQIKLDEKQSGIDACSENIAIYNTQINLCDNKIAELDSVISGHVNVSDKTERLKKVEGIIDNLKIKIVKQKELLTKFAQEYFLYFAMYPSIKSLYSYIQEQDKHGKLPPRIDKYLLDLSEKLNHCCVCDQPLSKHSVSHIDELKKELEVSSETSALLNKTVVLLRQFLTKISDYQNKRQILMNDFESLKQEYDQYSDEEEKLTKYLMNIPNNEEIAKAIEDKKDYREQRDTIIENKALEENNKKKLEGDYSNLEKELKSLIEKNHQLEHVNKQIEHCKKCRNILHETREELLAESRVEMENETFKVFSELLWKKNAYSKVEILEDYNFRLLDNYGEQTLGSCSAAERALLALSFTLALQKVSMHDSLLFIDTPLGRVDDENRYNFIKTLCEISKSKQVILTFTPTEYDTTVSAALQNQYSSMSKLTIENDVTVIK